MNGDETLPPDIYQNLWHWWCAWSAQAGPGMVAAVEEIAGAMLLTGVVLLWILVDELRRKR